jgi:hypothetical protein
MKRPPFLVSFRLVSLFSLFAALIAAVPAHAEIIAAEGGNVPPSSEAPMGELAVRRGVQGPEGLFTARLNLFVNASKSNFGDPVSLAPDLYYAFTDTLQLGLLHSSPMGWQTLPGAGLCLSGKDHGCPHVYDNVALDLMYGLLYGDVHLSLHTSLYFAKLSDPIWPMWTVGLSGKIHFTRDVAFFFDPQVGITLDHRSLYKDQLFIPVALQLQASPFLSIDVLSGVQGQLSALGDHNRAPLGLGLVGNVGRHLDLGLRFSFDNLLGHELAGQSRTDERSIGLLVTIRS